MKILVRKDLLEEAAANIQVAIGGRLSTLPILSNILIEATGSALTLTATNLDITVRTVIEAVVEKNGIVTVPAKTFVGIVKELNAPEISLEAEQKALCTIKAGACTFKLRGLPPEEFPPIEIPPATVSFLIEQEKLRSMLRLTSFAASTEETRYILNGVLFHIKPEELVLVATDGRRLALTRELLPVSNTEEVQVVVPSKSIRELERLLGKEGKVEISIREQSKILFKMPGNGGIKELLLITKLIEGTYPAYSQVIPKTAKARVTLNREEFLQALRRVQFVTSERSTAVKLQFEPYQISLMAGSAEIGEATETIAIQYEGEPVTIAFNPNFLIEPLRHLDTENVFFEINDEFTPAMLKINGNFLYVVMPMRATP